MEPAQLLIIAAAVLAFGVISKRLARSVLTPPMVFVALGIVMGPGGLGWLRLDADGAMLHTLAELTLVVVLFTDAARIDLRVLRRELGLPVRLLGIGMPLTILAGAVLAALLFDEIGIWEAAVLAAILAPTDAALGQAVVSSPKVPLRIRQALNVESGLNDGIALPFVMLFAALAVAAGGAGDVGGAGGSAGGWAAYWLRQVTFGPLAGIAVGFAGGRVVGWCSRRGWMSHNFQQLAGLALALVAFTGAELIGGNGLIAAFCAGLTIGNTSRGVCRCLYDFAETEGQLLVLLAFLLFGSILVWPALEHVSPVTILYAVLSLTVVRAVPVAISLAGTRVKPITTAYLGWFGPRGLASVLFGLIILEQTNVPHREALFGVVIVTVLMSVVAHGATAYPGAGWYAAHLERHRDRPGVEEHAPVTEMPVRVPDPGE